MNSYGYTRDEFVAGWCLSDVMNFTRHFFRYANNDDRKFVVGEHHVRICEKLNEVLQGKCRRLIINIPPRYGKTELAVKNFIAMGLALNPKSKFIHLSYSGTLAIDNSVAIKDIVNSEEYKRLFPGTRVKFGSDTKSRWDTEAGGCVYATSTLGQVTGFGAGLVGNGKRKRYVFGGAIVIDDPIKPEDAFSEIEREKVNRRFETTIRNRLNSRETPIIVIMQRLHEHDLCGYLQEIEPDEWEVLSLPAIGYEDGEPKALWDFKFTLDELYNIKKANPMVFETQYMQNPTPLEGLMYGAFKTYHMIPFTRTAIRKNYTDTADTGADYLCSINYVETETGNYITDVLYTDKPMEYTEPMVAAMLHRYNVDVANIESNNGGRGFARQVEAQTRILGNNRTRVAWFHQSANKDARIYSRSNEVTNLTYFPADWESRWPEFARHIKGFRKDGKDAHDDAEDALTGTIEMRGGYRGDFKYYDTIQEGRQVVFIMPDNGEKFIVLIAVVNEYINITGVIYRDGYDEAKMRKAVKYADDVVFECDKAFFRVARELRDEHEVRIMHKNPKPMLRISAQKSFVNEKVRFRKIYDVTVDYIAFMDALRDEENHFEAMDAVSGLADYVSRKYMMQQ